MSRWTDQWRDFVRRASYVHNLTEENISNDQFWRSYGIYDQVLMHSGYPGEILTKVSSFIPARATFLDIGAGTGAFAIPLSRKTAKTIAIDPSAYQLQILIEQYHFSKKGSEELLGHLSREGRLHEREDGKWAAFSAIDALLYLIR